ncbi:hypothetical protein PsYK624_166070 [Phanerochaete sordida]|uniref:Uncharacterized protein n=1 Tax=Phanerochaete sordida TaxID=48140 RepID=A0A9P3GSX3_9APHY|nr:hypothetical protein PsYK624_166070 [Phanerochaete sordida]
MSSVATPVSGYGSPAPSVSPVPYVSPVSRLSPTPVTYVHHGTHKANYPKPKPVNIFSNDGTFLERFQRMKRDEEDRKKQEEALARKREFDNRFRKRGKRPSPPLEDSNDTAEISPPKKMRTDSDSSRESITKDLPTMVV